MKAVRLELERLEESGTGGSRGWRAARPQVELAGTAAVEQRGKPRGLRDAALELAWVDPASAGARVPPRCPSSGRAAAAARSASRDRAPLPDAPAALRLRLLLARVRLGAVRCVNPGWGGTTGSPSPFSGRTAGTPTAAVTLPA